MAFRIYCPDGIITSLFHTETELFWSILKVWNKLIIYPPTAFSVVGNVSMIPTSHNWCYSATKLMLFLII